MEPSNVPFIFMSRMVRLGYRTNGRVAQYGRWLCDRSHSSFSYLISYSCFGRSDLAVSKASSCEYHLLTNPRGPGLFGNCWWNSLISLSQPSTSLDGWQVGLWRHWRHADLFTCCCIQDFNIIEGFFSGLFLSGIPLVSCFHASAIGAGTAYRINWFITPGVISKIKGNTWGQNS